MLIKDAHLTGLPEVMQRYLASGEFTWFRVKITDIEYNQSAAVTIF
jgi:hypothetical protein